MSRSPNTAQRARAIPGSPAPANSAERRACERAERIAELRKQNAALRADIAKAEDALRRIEGAALPVWMQNFMGNA